MKFEPIEGTDLRPCPHCASKELAVATDAAGKVVVCRECGATGPISVRGSPDGHALYLWNARYGEREATAADEQFARVRLH